MRGIRECKRVLEGIREYKGSMVGYLGVLEDIRGFDRVLGRSQSTEVDVL